MHMVSTVSPGAKKGSTAPYAYRPLRAGRERHGAAAHPRERLPRAGVDPGQRRRERLPRGCRLSGGVRVDVREGSTEHRAHAGMRTGQFFGDVREATGRARKGDGDEMRVALLRFDAPSQLGAPMVDQNGVVQLSRRYRC